MSSVILPGSYDPITLGHLAIIERAAREYDEVYVVAFINPKKQYPTYNSIKLITG